MQINRQFILVRIDKVKQTQSREKTGKIFLPQNFIFMKYNLQYGQITQIGEKALARYPFITVGDTAVFKHIIEEEDWRLIDKEDHPDHPGNYILKNELRLIDTDSELQLLAIIKPDGTWKVSDRYIFLNPQIEPISTAYTSALAEGVSIEHWANEGALLNKIEDLKIDEQNIKEQLNSTRNPDKFEELYKYLAINAKERDHISRLINAKKICKGKIELIGDRISQEMGLIPGDIIAVDDINLLYPLSVLGKTYQLIHTDFISLKMSK